MQCESGFKKDFAMSGSKRANGLTYRDAGVDIDAGNAFVKRIAPLAKATARPGADGGLGGFGALFDLKAAGYDDPVLVATTDGVGTKLKIAIETGTLNTVGIDLVGMCVNDLLAQGAEPLFFLDYFATGRLDVDEGAAIVEGITEGCRQSGAALIGGETAEMPGLYTGKDFDLAGFSVGALERGTLLPRADVQAGDVILGLGSNGLHSNGFSLVRKVMEVAGLGFDAVAPFGDGGRLSEALLSPTRIYVKSVLPLIRDGRIKAAAHITGGGLLENVPRVLPGGLDADIRLDAWPLGDVFRWLRDAGGLQGSEMLRTFNCGIGFVLIVASDDAEALVPSLEEAGEAVFEIGVLTPSDQDNPQTRITGQWAAD